ncbi:hypothetical protein PMAYCL1PPCAC_26682 [Pristionchus mayeri]|uniref:F-box domain-containing protein n=1 Tax=Pristionchus mayeri TaxID=1317129 RepID=A0AAN5I8F5_9BILA|nr:hypothetical protein PMAYCL1PPCAC_26682 [Pristionchus mayeri]
MRRLIQMLDKIAPELLTSILGNTTTTDKLNTSLVCRRVQSVICSTRSLKKRPDEIKISMKAVHPVPYQIGRLRVGKPKLEKGKGKVIVTLSRNQDTRGRQKTIDTLEADEVNDSVPSTSTEFPVLEEILSQCIHGRTLTLRGITINIALLDLLSSSSTELYRVTVINLELCVFADEEKLTESLHTFFSKTSVQFLTLEFCREEGIKRIICDELFCGLHHLQRLDLQERIPGTNAITENLVESWVATSAPYIINFRNVKTAISVESIIKLVEYTVRSPRIFKTVWNIGAIDRCDKREFASLFILAHPDLSIKQDIDNIGQRHIQIMHPFLEISFTTTGW